MRHGLNVQAYPDGMPYSGVSTADVAETFNSHLEGSRSVEPLLVKAGIW